MKRNIGVLLLLLTFSVYLFNCAKPNNPDIAGNGTQTGNALVSGRLYTSTGSGAIGAKVLFVKVNYNPYSKTLGKLLATTDTVSTDSSGIYGTNDLDTGTYNIFGTGTDGNLSLLDSVTITEDTQAVASDTLRAPGSLSGFIKMQGTDDPRTVFVIPLGTNGFATTSASGGFSLTDMAEGQYSVRFISILDKYLPLDTTFLITAAQTLSLPDSIELPLVIPTPTGFKSSYDSLKQIVTLSWDKDKTGRVKGYNVYRQHLGSADSLLTPVDITDTFYVDSTPVQDETYIYRVASVNLANEVGVKTDGDSVVVVSAIKILSQWGDSGIAESQLYQPYKIAIDKDGNIYVNDNRKKRIQKFDSLGAFISSLPDTFNEAGGITIDNQNNVFIADGRDKRIYKFSSSGDLLLLIDTAAGAYTDVAVDSNGMIYAVGQISNYGYIWKFDSTGVFDTSWSTGQAFFGLTIGPDSRIYVFGYQFITIYSLDGKLINSWTIPINFMGQSFHSRDIRDLVVTNAGEVIVSELESDQLFIYDSTGNFLTKGGSFKNLTGLALDENDNLFATEIDNEVILRIDY